MFDTKFIKSRLIIIIGVLATLLIGIGGLGLYGINQSNNGMQSVYEDRAVPLMNLAVVNDKWQLIRLDAVIAANSGDLAIAKTRTVNSANLRKEIQQIWAQYETTEFSPEEKLLAETYK